MIINVTSIDSHKFSQWPILTSVTTNAKSIGDSAFTAATTLKSVMLATPLWDPKAWVLHVIHLNLNV